MKPFACFGFIFFLGCGGSVVADQGSAPPDMAVAVDLASSPDLLPAHSCGPVTLTGQPAVSHSRIGPIAVRPWRNASRISAGRMPDAQTAPDPVMSALGLATMMRRSAARPALHQLGMTK